MTRVIFSVTTIYVSIMEWTAGQGEGFNAVTVEMDIIKKLNLVHLLTALQGTVRVQQTSGISPLCRDDLLSVAYSPWRVSWIAETLGLDGSSVEYLYELKRQILAFFPYFQSFWDVFQSEQILRTHVLSIQL